ncbi:hypothetical protein SAMD00023353_1501890 [Rosellinia necatrix]|uniref:Bola-like protein n=1 Tax=Rosellinia necatrix TaxID=77044 RepID=A0A1W2TRG4_ROSNE|nr:hypothetical protein SAMD00023353_1501890 [Rosellinia necatrix]
MLRSQHRRITISAFRQASPAIRTRPVGGLALHVQLKVLLPARSPQPTRTPHALRFSTTSSPPEPATPATPATPEKPDYLNDAESAIWDKLLAEFDPTELVVQDISGGCGSMYGIEIASEKFRGVGLLKQQRMVNAVLGEEMKSWHGIQLRTRTP